MAFWDKFKKIGGKFPIKMGSRAFYVWIAYQAIKGTITLTLIWIPLFHLWWKHR